MTKRRRGLDPVARLREEARWSGFTNSWSRPFHGSRRARRIVLVYFGILVGIGVLAAIISLSHA